MFALEINSKYPTYIFSNTDEMHFPYLMKNYDFLKQFSDRLMLSYELKALKPDPQIYIDALKLYNLNPAECLFIDDKAENIEAAISYGMQGIVHKDYQTTKKQMINMGLEL